MPPPHYVGQQQCTPLSVEAATRPGSHSRQTRLAHAHSKLCREKAAVPTPSPVESKHTKLAVQLGGWKLPAPPFSPQYTTGALHHTNLHVSRPFELVHHRAAPRVVHVVKFYHPVPAAWHIADQFQLPREVQQGVVELQCTYQTVRVRRPMWAVKEDMGSAGLSSPRRMRQSHLFLFS